MRCSVLVADDNALIRKTVKGLFEPYPEFEICGEAENGVDAIGRATSLQPDLIILDLDMPVMNGFEAAHAIRDRCPQTRIILFTIYSGPTLYEEATRIGIDAVVPKDELKNLV